MLKPAFESRHVVVATQTSTREFTQSSTVFSFGGQPCLGHGQAPARSSRLRCFIEHALLIDWIMHLSRSHPQNCLEAACSRFAV